MFPLKRRPPSDHPERFKNRLLTKDEVALLNAGGHTNQAHHRRPATAPTLRDGHDYRAAHGRFTLGSMRQLLPGVMQHARSLP
jgi:hypothetical protein